MIAEPFAIAGQVGLSRSRLNRIDALMQDFIDRGVQSKDDPAALAKIRDEVKSFAANFPMPH